MKYVVLLCDGASDEPQQALNNKTVLQYAHKPNIDGLAKKGICGYIQTTPEGFPPGSDVCNLSIFGYDPGRYYTGRSPLEALSMGIDLKPEDMAFRCNLVELSESFEKMVDFTAGHISNNHAGKAIQKLNEIYKGSNVEFYEGLSYRHIMVVRGKHLEVNTTPPHDIINQNISSFLPSGKDSEFLRKIMSDSRNILNSQDTGIANSIWLWGQGIRPDMPTYKELYGKNGAVIAAVDLIKGIGIAAGMDIVDVPGVTGFVDTNFEGKATYAMNALKDHDYVFIHVEAPDESGHMGSVENKVQSIERIDRLMLPIILKELSLYDDYRILVTPDHPTFLRTKTHSADPVPALLYGSGIAADSNNQYSEFITPSFNLKDGYKIAELLFK